MIKMISQMKKHIIYNDLSQEELALLSNYNETEQLRLFSAIQAVKETAVLSGMVPNTEAVTVYIDKNGHFRLREYPDLYFGVTFDRQYIIVSDDKSANVLKGKRIRISKNELPAFERRSRRVIPVPDMRKKK